MRYLLHNKRYNEYLQAQEDLNRVLDEWIMAFQKTQPKSSTYGDKVQGNTITNNIEEYVIEVEDKHLYKRIHDAGLIIAGKKELVELAEADLRKSKNVYDLIYTAKWVDGLKPKEIYRKLDLMGMNYSTTHIYRIIKNITVQVDRSFNA